MSWVKYLLDEHVNPRLRAALLRRWPEMVVWLIGDPGAPGRGTPDPEILSWCESSGFLLVTDNRATMPVHLRAHLVSGRHVPGVLVLEPNMSLGATVDELELIWGAGIPEDCFDQVMFLPVR